MKKYIEQEAVIRLIKTEGFNEKYDLGNPKDNDWFCEEVNRIPSANVVEVSAIHDSVYEAMQVLNSIYSAKRIGNADYMDLMGAISLIFHNCGARMDGGAK